jgi:hypothetical protein
LAGATLSNAFCGITGKSIVVLSTKLVTHVSFRVGGFGSGRSTFGDGTSIFGDLFCIAEENGPAAIHIIVM